MQKLINKLTIKRELLYNKLHYNKAFDGTEEHAAIGLKYEFVCIKLYVLKMINGIYRKVMK